MLKPVARSLIFLILGSVASVAAFNCSPRPAAESSPKLAERVLLPSPAFAAQGQNGVVIADIAEKVVTSVVNISTERVTRSNRPNGPFNDPFFRQFFGDRFRQMPRERRERSLGSGVIVDAAGVILTNNHVIEGATDIRVTLSDGREVEAEKLGADPQTDVGVLKLKEDIQGLEPLAFGDADSLRLGDIVLAVGNPFGVGQTVTMGIVSATGRANVGIVDYEDFIQTDAAINPGNSGGALVNSRGELVGINTAILSRSGGYQGIGFAIPSNMARRIMDSLMNDGKVSRGFRGISIQNVDRTLAEALSLADTRGVLVGGVTDDSPAAKGGIQTGDVILSVDGEAVTNTGELRNAIAIAGGGTTVSLEVFREGKKKTLKVKLGEKAEEGQAIAPDGDDPAKTEASAGLSVSPLDARLRQQLRVDESIADGTLIVVGVQPESPAARAGLRPGDAILEVNRRKVETVGELREALAAKKGTLPVLVQRGGLTQFLALSLKE